MRYEVRPLPHSPAGLTFWGGEWHFAGARVVPYVLSCPRDQAPSAEQLALRDRVRDDFAAFEVAARLLVVRELRRTPDAYGLSREQVDEMTEENAPLDAPEVTFFEDGAWLLRFAESSLPGCRELGVGVDFVGEEPVRWERLDGSGWDDEP